MTSRPILSAEEDRQVAASERIFAAVHAYLVEMEETEEGGEEIEIRQFEAMKAAIAVADRARDEQPKAENPKGLSPQGASPVRAAEAPASLSQVNPPPEDAVSQPRREDWRNRGLTNAERLIVFASYHREKLGEALAGELEELANEWMEEVDALQPHRDPTTGGEAPGRDDRDLFDRLHIKSMTREWFADSLPPTLDGYLAVLRRRLTRAASL